MADYLLDDSAVKYAAVNVAASGNNTIVAAVAGKRIRVLSYVLVADAAVAAKWRSANTDLTGAMSFAANGGVSAGEVGAAHFRTAVNEALNLNLSTATGVRGHITYLEA